MRGSAKRGRALVAIGLGLVSAALPSPAAAQGSVARGLDDPSAVPESSVWLLDDGRGDELPWDDLDPTYDPLPLGLVHFATQLRVGGVVGGGGQAAQGPAAELAGILDVRYGRGPWHLRIGVVLDLRWAEPTTDSFNLYHSSAFSMRGRIQPIAIDFGNLVSARVGADLGAQWVEDGRGGHFEVLPAFSGELVMRVFDAALEVGAYGGVQWTGSDVRDPMFGGGWTALVFQGVFGAFVAYVVP